MPVGHLIKSRHFQACSLALALASFASPLPRPARAQTPAMSDGAANPDADELRHIPLNRMRVLGSHNSYRPVFTDRSLAEQRRILGPDSAGVEYGHPSIARQLDLGLRQLEFDPLADPRGGLYAAPYVGQPESYAEMIQPGPKVLHVPFVDRRTSCLTLADCLMQVARWSRAHPNHHPIILTINPSQGHTDNPIMPDLPAFDEPSLAAVDAAAIAAFGKSNLITPDQIRAGHASLRDAVMHGGWPDISAEKGKVMLILDADREVMDAYRKGHPSLQGRVMFGFYPEDVPEAAFLNIQDPRQSEAEIRHAVAEGFIVRTRSDAETVEARRHDDQRLQAAVRSGAQIVSTDYYAGADDPLHLGFVVRLPR
jgi:hypothetical protein